jgi:hypothetical protein
MTAAAPVRPDPVRPKRHSAGDGRGGVIAPFLAIKFIDFVLVQFIPGI